MKLLLDAFWRAVAYCLHPRVIGLSLLPLLIGTGMALLLGWLYWEPAVAAVRATLESWSLVDAGLKAIEAYLGGSFRAMLVPLIVVGLAAPVIVVLSVLLVAVLMTPSVVRLVAERRFPDLAQRRGAGALASVAWSLGCSLLALVLLVVSLPLWLIPPLVMVLPPLIWGWLTYQVMSFDVLSLHADADERRALMREHRLPLLGIGVVSGYLGAAPSLLWAASALTLVFAPLLIAVSVWLYTLVFAFSTLWFSHYLLAALARHRERPLPSVVPPQRPGPPVLELIERLDPPAPALPPAAGTASANPRA